MFKSVRYTLYWNYYLNLLSKVYKNELQFIPCTYYKISKKYSIYDKNKLVAGSYEFFGNKSGLKFYEIKYYPLSEIVGMTQNMRGTDFGVRTQLKTEFMMPHTCFEPIEFDFISLYVSDDIVYPELFQVQNVEKEIFDEKTDFSTFYKVILKGSGFYAKDIQNQVLETFAYNDGTGKVYNIDTYNILNSYFINQQLLCGNINTDVNYSNNFRGIDHKIPEEINTYIPEYQGTSVGNFLYEKFVPINYNINASDVSHIDLSKVNIKQLEEETNVVAYNAY